MKNLKLLDQYRLVDQEMQIYGCHGDEKNGFFKVFVNGRSFYVVASDGGGWEHVSVSPCNQKRTVCPTWEEMCAIKDIFFDEKETVVEYHPAKSNYVNLHKYCLHLWRPNQDGEILPMPPVCFV